MKFFIDSANLPEIQEAQKLMVIDPPIVSIYSNYSLPTQASIRNPTHILKCAKAGADVVTCPLNAIMALLKHPLTDNGLSQFLNDYKKGNQ
jgi:transaldolase